jgi:hypothetical protein
MTKQLLILACAALITVAVPGASAAQSVVVLKGKLTGAIINGQVVIVLDSGTELRLSPSDVDRVLTTLANASPPSNAGNKETLASTGRAPVGVESNAAIDARCATRWTANPEMQAYCRQQQREALAALQQRTMATTEQRTIRLKCRADWPDDFQMQKYCEDEQLKTSSRSSM